MEKNICLPLGLCQKKYDSNATHLIAFPFLPQNTQEWDITSNSKGKKRKKTKTKTKILRTLAQEKVKKQNTAQWLYYTNGTPHLTAVYKIPPHPRLNCHERHSQPLHASSSIHQCWIVVPVGCIHILLAIAPAMTVMVHRYGLVIEGYPKLSVKATGSSVEPFDGYTAPLKHHDP